MRSFLPGKGAGSRPEGCFAREGGRSGGEVRSCGTDSGRFFYFLWIMSKRKGLSFDEKREKMLEIFQESVRRECVL